jgi:hypothetical protein
VRGFIGTSAGRLPALLLSAVIVLTGASIRLSPRELRNRDDTSPLLQAEGVNKSTSMGIQLVWGPIVALQFLEGFAFLTAFFGFAGSSNVASTVREISRSVRPLDTAFWTAFLMRFTAFFFFSFPSAIDSAVPSLCQIAITG